ncbi:MAG: DUF192 domain-containing protein [Byssovorax sp.]
MRRPARLSVIVAAPFLLAACACGTTACERKIEEPIVEDGPHPKVAATPAPPPVKERCIKKSPAEPKRKTPPSPDPHCPKDNLAHPPELRTGKVSFPEAKGETITVEVAETDATRQRGLMYRTKMAQDHGMIFRFDEKDNHTFWMHNTCIPLDMLYIDDDGMIVGIEENTPTMSDDTFEVGCDSKYVLEVNAGWTRAHGVMAGQKAKLEGI